MAVHAGGIDASLRTACMCCQFPCNDQGTATKHHPQHHVDPFTTRTAIKKSVAHTTKTGSPFSKTSCLCVQTNGSNTNKLLHACGYQFRHKSSNETSNTKESKHDDLYRVNPVSTPSKATQAAFKVEGGNGEVAGTVYPSVGALPTRLPRMGPSLTMRSVRALLRLQRHTRGMRQEQERRLDLLLSRKRR